MFGAPASDALTGGGARRVARQRCRNSFLLVAAEARLAATARLDFEVARAYAGALAADRRAEVARAAARKFRAPDMIAEKLFCANAVCAPSPY